MTELVEGKFQPRMEWNEVRSTALSLPKIAEKVGINGENLVFIGGFACFFLLRSTYGSEVTMHWRGTGDVDLVVFGRGLAERMLDAIKGDGEFVTKAEICDSHIRGKHCCYIWPRGFEGYSARDNPQKNWVQVDLYGQEGKQKVVLNDRKLESPDKILNNPPETIRINETLYRFAGLFDMMTLKFDVLTGASDLRPKDNYDLLGCLAIAEKREISPGEVYNNIVVNILGAENRKNSKKALENLSRIFQKSSCQFLPSRDYFHQFQTVYNGSHIL